MFGTLLVLLSLNTAALFILPGLAGVFYGTAAQNVFNTLGVFALFFELVLPFTLLGTYLKRPRFAPARPRYRPAPVGEYRGLDAATRRHLEESLRDQAATYAYLAEAERGERRTNWQLPAPGQAAARFTTSFQGDEVVGLPDGTWLVPRLRLHVEADGTTWKEL
jgi:hypothetical protein